ncbi:MAG: sulfite exporter TauE/SafE family protein [Christensenellaceae bacterium]|jgi:uncharacterized membrane protein YfcA|nr:sulfite exporter TauE/SafE family protein [Christensenellaceae bacterium]
MKKNGWMPYAAGFVSGICNGLMGAGGGMIAVAALKKLCKLPQKEAHATAIGVMLPLTVVSAGIYAFSGEVAWDVLCYVAPALLIGGMAGAKLTGKLSNTWLCRLFAAIMVAAGAWMIR